MTACMVKYKIPVNYVSGHNRKVPACRLAQASSYCCPSEVSHKRHIDTNTTLSPYSGNGSTSFGLEHVNHTCKTLGSFNYKFEIFGATQKGKSRGPWALNIIHTGKCIGPNKSPTNDHTYQV